MNSIWRIALFYCSPNSDHTFFEPFNEFMCKNQNSNLVLSGDFSISSVEWNGDFPEALSSSAEPFIEIVLLHGLTQLVKAPTRIKK